jgi:hypothetical protein
MKKTLRLAAAVIAMGLGLAAAPTLRAQFGRPAPTSPPRIVSGNDLGFRVEGTDPRTGAPIGTWVIRVNNEWVEIGEVPTLRPAK